MSNKTSEQTRLAQLEQENKLLWSVINQAPFFLYAKYTNHKFLILNQMLAKTFGTDNPYDVIGKSDQDLHPPELAEEFTAEERPIFESGEFIRDKEQMVYEADTHEPIWMSSTKQPLYDEDGKIIGLTGYAQSITKQKKLLEKHTEQAQLIEAQKQTLLEVSTPILPIFDRVLVMPLIGEIDNNRAQQIMRTMLQSITTYRAKIIILDITGVSHIDSTVADYLNRTVQAARLKGTQTVITGISDAVAETFVDLGIDWRNVEIQSDLQSGLQTVLDKMQPALMANKTK